MIRRSSSSCGRAATRTTYRRHATGPIAVRAVVLRYEDLSRDPLAELHRADFARLRPLMTTELQIAIDYCRADRMRQRTKGGKQTRSRSDRRRLGTTAHARPPRRLSRGIRRHHGGARLPGAVRRRANRGSALGYEAAQRASRLASTWWNRLTLGVEAVIALRYPPHSRGVRPPLLRQRDRRCVHRTRSSNRNAGRNALTPGRQKDRLPTQSGQTTIVPSAIPSRAREIESLLLVWEEQRHASAPHRVQKCITRDVLGEHLD